LKCKRKDTIYIDSVTDLDAINAALTKLRRKWKKQGYAEHKVALCSLTPILSYAKQAATMIFLQIFIGKGKPFREVCLFDLQEGVHAEHEVSAVKNLMDGVIEFKSERGKYFLRMEGRMEIRTSRWLPYEHKAGVLELPGPYDVKYIS
jgi:hypothetical protein